MFSTLVSAVVVCVGALAVGQAALRLCGEQRWSWQAAPVGLSLLMLLASPALHLPGRATTTAAMIALAVAGSLVAAVRIRAMRPPPVGVLAGLPTAVLATVPFIAAGHAGTLGWSFNNDMAFHLIWAEAYRSQAVAGVNTLINSYPLGPHGLAAALSSGVGIRIDEAFAGVTLAAPVLMGWTALGAYPDMRTGGRLVVATVVGMPFLVAGYYGQGSFKELIQAALVLGILLEVRRGGVAHPRLRWAPLAVMVAGVLSVYSVPGLAWPLELVGICTLVGLASMLFRLSVRGAVRKVRRDIVPIGLAAGVLLVVLVPQIPRIARFFDVAAGGPNGTGIPKDVLGNLAGRISLFPAFGIWNNPDYRLPGSLPLTAELWSVFVVGLVVTGGVWSLRRGDWVLPVGVLSALAIWAYSDHSQSPYVAAKALVILSPLLLLLAVRPLVEREGMSAPLLGSWWRVAAPVLAVVLLYKVVDSSLPALRYSKVGPVAHLDELRELRPHLDRRPTLFLGNDDFVRWELAGVPTDAPVIGIPQLAMRPEKAWVYGQNVDFDSLDAPTLNRYTWVISPRDAAASAPPPAFKVVRRTRDFDLYRRVAPVVRRATLTEGEAPAAVLNCRSPQGRAILRGGGVAAVRTAPVAVPVPAIGAGDTVTVRLPLGAGQWDVVAPYVSPQPIRVTAPGIDTTLVANLDRPGPRWPVGRLDLARPTTVPFRLHASKEWLTLRGGASAAYLTSLIAVRRAPPRLVPVRLACGKFVDWYRPAAGR